MMERKLFHSQLDYGNFKENITKRALLFSCLRGFMSRMKLLIYVTYTITTYTKKRTLQKLY